MSCFQPEGKGTNWHYRFMFRGKVIRRSTRQTNHRVAKELESEHKSRLAKGDVGIYEKTPAPTLAEFSKEFLSWAAMQFQSKPKTFLFYRNGVRRLLEYAPLAAAALDSTRISEVLVGYQAKRQAAGLKVSSVNRELQTLRRLLHLAKKWGRVESTVSIEMLPGEVHRERVISRTEEARYLAAASPLLAEVATVLVDSGMRPEECFRQRWENVSWVNGRHGSILVAHGKTKAARRSLPMTPRVRTILERRWKEANEPQEGWIWPAPTRSGHAEPSTLKKQHRNAIKRSKVRPFVLYSLRHSFLTRLGESGCDTWTLARIAGHSSISISSRYVHPSGDAVLAAMERPGGHEIGHTEENTDSDTSKEKQLSA